jgi:hypothetical protein
VFNNDEELGPAIPGSSPLDTRDDEVDANDGRSPVGSNRVISRACAIKVGNARDAITCTPTTRWLSTLGDPYYSHLDLDHDNINGHTTFVLVPLGFFFYSFQWIK